MAISDIYTADSGSLTLASTAQLPILDLRGQTTIRGWIVGVRMKVLVTGAAAGNTALFTLARSGTAGTGGTASTPKANDFSAPASIVTAFVPPYTIAPAVTTILGEWLLPLTVGSMWEEFPPLGYEWGIPASTSQSTTLFCTLTSTTGTPAVEGQLIFSE